MLRRIGLSAPLIALPLLAGCHGLIWGNLLVFAISVGIFVGTLALGRA